MFAFLAPALPTFSRSISGARVCQTRAAPSNVTMKASPAMPFMEQPESLDDGAIIGNVGFDPLNFSTVFNLKFLQEAEIKHCRVAMLGVVGLILPEIFRFPEIPAMGAGDAHSYFVNEGGMSQILLWCSFFEIFGAYALKETLNGERAPGYFGFDPLGFSKNPATSKKYQLSELKNGRLAMCAVGGLYHATLVSKQGILEQLSNFHGVPAHLYTGHF